MNLDQCRIIQLPKILNAAGNLTFVESDRHVPFDIKRVYYLYDVPGGAMRGGHLAGDLSRAFPIAAVTYGDFHVTGPGLNTHDGVFQVPADKWRFQRGTTTVEYTSATTTSIYDAFGPNAPVSPLD